MRPRPLWSVSVITLPGTEEIVAELLEEQFAQPACSFTDTRKGRTTVSVYLTNKPAVTGLTLARAWQEHLKANGLPSSGFKIQVRRIPPQNWAESWKRHFKPIKLGRRLLVRPSWSKQRSRNGEAVVEIDPGLSFGTGHHPTTAFCLKELAARRSKVSFLDIGTGSGILAIAAAKLGYAPVTALDSDPDALRIARRNALNNGLGRRIRFLQQDVSQLPIRRLHGCGMVCANLTADLLLGQSARIIAQVQPDGLLILAGILEREFSQIQNAYEMVGLLLVKSRREKEWRSGVFKSPQRPVCYG